MKVKAEMKVVKIMSIKHLAQCLQHSTCSINVDHCYWMDEELCQRLKSGTGKIVGFGVLVNYSHLTYLSYELSSIIIFIFALFESKFMD